MEHLKRTMIVVGRGFGLWTLSILCEVPFFLLAGIMVKVFEGGPFFPVYGDGIELVLLVTFFSFWCRLISLHLLGSWVLKWFFLKRGAGPFLYGLADFLLANLWVGVWAFLDPEGFAGMLFKDPSGSGFQLTMFWYLSIPPIALGSATFRLFLGLIPFLKVGDRCGRGNGLVRRTVA